MASIDGEMADAWLMWSLTELAGSPRVRVMPRTTAFGYFPHNNLGLVERLTDHLANPAEGRARERLWQVRAREVVLATGAHRAAARISGQRPARRDAGRRGAELSSASYGVRDRLAGSGGHDDGWSPTARRSSSRRAASSVMAIADLRSRVPGAAADAARDAGIEVAARRRPCAAHEADFGFPASTSTAVESPAISC